MASSSTKAQQSPTIRMDQLRQLIDCFTIPDKARRAAPAASAISGRRISRGTATPGSRQTPSTTPQTAPLVGGDVAQAMQGQGSLPTNLKVPPPHELRVLNESEFVDAVGGVLTQFPLDEIRQWFCRIDADDQRVVGWGDFASFVLSRAQYQQQTDSRGAEYASQCLPATPPLGHCHGSPITACVYHSRLGRLFTGAQDGTVRMWAGSTMEPMRVVLNMEKWITDMCFIRNDTRLLVTAVDRSVCVVDARTADLLRSYAGQQIPSKNSLAFHKHHVDIVERKLAANVRNDRSALGLGPGRTKAESSTTATILQNVQQGAATPGSKRNDLQHDTKRLEQHVLAGFTDVANSVCSMGMSGQDDRVAFAQRNGYVKIFTLPHAPQRLIKADISIQAHDASVNQVIYSKYLQGFITCSDDHTLKIIDPNRRDRAVVRTFSEGGHHRAVQRFAWSDSGKVLASCSAERTVLLWDRMQETPINRFAALSAPVVNVVLNDVTHQLVVNTADNAIRIYDVRTNTLLQTIEDHDVPREYGNFTAVAMADQRVVCCTSYPVAYLSRRELGAGGAAAYRGHLSPCVAVAHNASARQLITVDSESAFMWDTDDGEPRYFFNITSFRQNLLEELRLTASCTDALCRRLVTGFHRGQVVVWNLSNGQALAQLRDERFVGKCVHATLAMERQGDTFYVIAIGNCVIVTDSSAKHFTISARGTFTAPPVLGHVVCLESTNENTVACGMTSGAILFLNIMTLQVEGAPLLPPLSRNAMESSMINYGDPMAMLSSQSMNARSFVAEPGERPNAAAAQSMAEGQQSLRVETLKVIHGGAEPLMLACYTNGQVMLWNTLWRSASSVGHVSVPTGLPTSFRIVQVSDDEVWVVHGDDQGALYLWSADLLFRGVFDASASAARAHGAEAGPSEAQLYLCEEPFTYKPFSRTTPTNVLFAGLLNTRPGAPPDAPPDEDPEEAKGLSLGSSAATALPVPSPRCGDTNGAGEDAIYIVAAPAHMTETRTFAFRRAETALYELGTLGAPQAWDYSEPSTWAKLETESKPDEATTLGTARRGSNIADAVIDEADVAALLATLNAGVVSRMSNGEGPDTTTVSAQRARDGRATVPLTITAPRLSMLIPSSARTTSTPIGLMEAAAAHAHAIPSPPASRGTLSSRGGRRPQQRDGLVKPAPPRPPIDAFFDGSTTQEDTPHGALFDIDAFGFASAQPSPRMRSDPSPKMRSDAASPRNVARKNVKLMASIQSTMFRPTTTDLPGSQQSSPMHSTSVAPVKSASFAPKETPPAGASAPPPDVMMDTLGAGSTLGLSQLLPSVTAAGADPTSPLHARRIANAAEAFARRQGERLQRVVAVSDRPLEQRVATMQRRLRIGEAVSTPSGVMSTGESWATRAATRLPPQPLGAYKNADVLLQVLHERNPAAASRASGANARPSIFGPLERRHLPTVTTSNAAWAVNPSGMSASPTSAKGGAAFPSAGGGDRAAGEGPNVTQPAPPPPPPPQTAPQDAS